MKYILNQNNCIQIIVVLFILCIVTLPFAFCFYKGYMSRWVMAGKISFIICLLTLSSAIGFSKPYINDAIDVAVENYEKANSKTMPILNSYHSHSCYMYADLLEKIEFQDGSKEISTTSKRGMAD